MTPRGFPAADATDSSNGQLLWWRLLRAAPK
jgi:hypothetical protein